MERITPADVQRMREDGCDRSTIAAAEEWLEKCRRADELSDLVCRAFSDVELGEGIGLRESDGIDDYAGPGERMKLRASDEKHDWRRIPAQLLNRCHAAPSFLDAKGMRFHTPAFLVSELRGDFIQDFLGRLIDGSYSATDFPKLLTDEQRNAIIECIRFYGSIEHHSWERDVIDSAIARFRDPKQRRISVDDEAGHLSGITVSSDRRELVRHLIFISVVRPEALQELLPSELGEDEREPRDGNQWQIITDPQGWKPAFRSFESLDQQAAPQPDARGAADTASFPWDDLSRAR